MSSKIILRLGLLFALILIVYLSKSYRALEYFGLFKNQLILSIENENVRPNDLSIYLVREITIRDTNRFSSRDTLLIYGEGEMKEPIPDSYGPNRILIKYGNNIYDKIGIWKYKEWYKYNFNISLPKTNDDKISVEWRIGNLFEKKSGEFVLE